MSRPRGHAVAAIGAAINAAAAAVWIPALLGGAMVLLSVRLGPDASWDLRNYHLYDAFAALRKPPFRDLVPAQLQSFNPPTADLPSLWLRFRLNRWPNLLDALLALPSAVAVALAWAIGRRLVPAECGRDRLALALAVMLGATGAAGLPTTGTSMSEMPTGCLALGGLLLLLDGLDGRSRRLPVAGGLFGVAVALKLTLVTLGLAALAALAMCGDGGPGRRIRRTAACAAGMAAGLVAVAGPWWWHLAALTGNPLFPFLNGVFRSPLLPPVSITDARFRPGSLGRAIAYPFIWGFTRRPVVAELTLRDPRLALALLAGLGCAVPPWRGAGPAGCGRRAAGLLVFCGTGFVLWEAQFSILRYLAPIELLAGLPILLALRRLAAPAAVAPLMAAILVGCTVWTIYPDWGRASPADTAASVVLPPLPPDAMVLLLSGDPMAYVAAFAAPTVRFVGVDNNLVHPGDRFLLAQRIERAVREHPGPLFGLEVPGGPTPTALAYYGLRRMPSCTPVRTNLERDGLRLCRLGRLERLGSLARTAPSRR